VANIEQMMNVANSCAGYRGIREGFENNIGSETSKSCTNCRYLRNDKCQKNLFDLVLTSLDQT
jgi:hypothetical protein